MVVGLHDAGPWVRKGGGGGGGGGGDQLTHRRRKELERELSPDNVM